MSHHSSVCHRNRTTNAIAYVLLGSRTQAEGGLHEPRYGPWDGACVVVNRTAISNFRQGRFCGVEGANLRQICSGFHLSRALSASPITRKNSSATASKTTQPAITDALSRFEAALKIRYPRPALAAMNSPTTAPLKDQARPSLKPVMIQGTHQGKIT